MDNILHSIFCNHHVNFDLYPGTLTQCEQTFIILCLSYPNAFLTFPQVTEYMKLFL